MFGVFKSVKKLMAIKNAMNAKVMYLGCDEYEKLVYKNAAITLYRTYGKEIDINRVPVERHELMIEESNRMEANNDFQFYTLVWMSMDSLNVAPTLIGNEWFLLSNPFLLDISEKDIQVASGWFLEKHGFNVGMKI